MIEVTRLNGTQILVNADLIELVEETPDTVITFTTGRKIIVKEYDLDEVTADWHIEYAQKWVVRARKALNGANGEENEN